MTGQRTQPDDKRKQLNARTIGDLDRGHVALAIDHAIKQMAQDIIARHGDKAKRSVTIKIIATPVLDETTAALDTISLKVEVTQGIPKRTNAKPYQLLPMGDGTMQFSPTAPQDPRQIPMFDGSTPVQNGSTNIEIDKTTGELVGGDEYDEVGADDDEAAEI